MHMQLDHTMIILNLAAKGGFEATRKQLSYMPEAFPIFLMITEKHEMAWV